MGIFLGLISLAILQQNGFVSLTVVVSAALIMLGTRLGASLAVVASGQRRAPFVFTCLGALAIGALSLGLVSLLIQATFDSFSVENAGRMLSYSFVALFGAAIASALIETQVKLSGSALKSSTHWNTRAAIFSLLGSPMLIYTSLLSLSSSTGSPYQVLVNGTPITPNQAVQTRTRLGQRMTVSTPFPLTLSINAKAAEDIISYYSGENTNNLDRSTDNDRDGTEVDINHETIDLRIEVPELLLASDRTSPRKITVCFDSFRSEEAKCEGISARDYDSLFAILANRLYQSDDPITPILSGDALSSEQPANLEEDEIIVRISASTLAPWDEAAVAKSISWFRSLGTVDPETSQNTPNQVFALAETNEDGDALLRPGMLYTLKDDEPQFLLDYTIDIQNQDRIFSNGSTFGSTGADAGSLVVPTDKFDCETIKQSNAFLQYVHLISSPRSLCDYSGDKLDNEELDQLVKRYAGLGEEIRPAPGTLALVFADTHPFPAGSLVEILEETKYGRLRVRSWVTGPRARLIWTLNPSDIVPVLKADLPDEDFARDAPKYEEFASDMLGEDVKDWFTEVERFSAEEWDAFKKDLPITKDAASLIEESGLWQNEPVESGEEYPSVLNGGLFIVTANTDGQHEGFASLGTIVQGLGEEGWDSSSSTRFQVIYGHVTGNDDGERRLWIENTSVASLETNDWRDFQAISDDMSNEDPTLGDYDTRCEDARCTPGK